MSPGNFPDWNKFYIMRNYFVLNVYRRILRKDKQKLTFISLLKQSLGKFKFFKLSNWIRFSLQLIIIGVFFACSANVKSQNFADAPNFNHKRGFYNQSIRLKLSSKNTEGTIRYTLDGSKPTRTNGQNYSKPIKIKSTAMVRAYTYAENIQDSKIKTHSYLFSEKCNSTKK